MASGAQKVSRLVAKFVLYGLPGDETQHWIYNRISLRIGEALEESLSQLNLLRVHLDSTT